MPSGSINRIPAAVLTEQGGFRLLSGIFNRFSLQERDPMERRTFVKSLAATLAALPLMPRVGSALAEQLQSLAADLQQLTDDTARWRRVRTEFLLNPGLVHLNCGSLGAAPRLVVDAVAGYLHAMEGDPVHNEWGGIGNGMEPVRTKAAEFIGAQPDEVAITRNTTEGMNAVATGLELQAGDEILTTNHEHGGGMVCWQYLAKRRGVAIRQLEMPAPVRDAAQILERVEKNLTNRTRVCSFSHVETITGLQMPLAEIARLTRPRDILLVCDGAQAPGMLAVDVKALGVDTYASSSHKWMLAPKGSGLLYIRKEVQDRVQPLFVFSGYGVYSASSGTREVPNILGHGVAMDFHNTLGRSQVEARCRQLSLHLRQRLSAIPGLRLLTPSQPELSSAMVTFAVDPAKGKNSAIADRLFKEENISIKTVPSTYAVEGGVPPKDYNALRFSTHVYNSESELDRTADLIAAMVSG
jgi:isopenicillin-N epimerase